MMMTQEKHESNVNVASYNLIILKYWKPNNTD